MATLTNTTVAGRVTQSQAAINPNELTRKGEMDAGFSGTAPRVHTHVTAQITDLAQQLVLLVEGLLPDTATVDWTAQAGLLYAQIKTHGGGGLLQLSDGLAVDPSGVSVPGHKHQAADIVDLQSVLVLQIRNAVTNTDTVAWTNSNGLLYANAQLVAQGGLLDTTGGLQVDFGSGTNQVARGNHTHSQLHNPVTLAPSNSLTLVLSGQQLGAEVLLAALGGLKLASGVGVDWGSSHFQVPFGDHTHAQLHNPVTVVSTPTLDLFIDGNQVLSGTVRCATGLGAGYAPVQTGSNGLYLRLGTGASDVAAGNHGHNAATSSTDGFMAASDKARLDAAVTQLASGTRVSAVGTSTLDLFIGADSQVISGTVRLSASPGFGKVPVKADFNGLYMDNIVPSGTGLRSVVAGVEQGGATLVTNALVATGAGILEAKLSLNFPTHANTNDPTTTQKAALAGSAGAPGAGNPYVTSTDTRLLTVNQLAALSGTGGAPGASNPFVTSGDSRLLTEQIRLTLNGFGAPLPTEARDYVVAGWNGTVTGWHIIADQVDIVDVDILLQTYAGFPPDTADTIAGTEHPALAGATINRNVALSTWTPAFNKGDIFGAKLLSGTGTVATKVDIFLAVRKLE